MLLAIDSDRGMEVEQASNQDVTGDRGMDVSNVTSAEPGLLEDVGRERNRLTATSKTRSSPLMIPATVELKRDPITLTA